LVVEDDQLAPARAVATALAVAELIAEHAPEIGSAIQRDAPSWTTTEIGGVRIHHPLAVRCFFRAGSLTDHDAIVVLNARPAHGRASVSVLARPEDQTGARELLDRLSALAAARNPYKGKVLRASVAGGLSLDVIQLNETLTRSTVIVPQPVWDEIDLGIRAVRDQHEMLNAHGLGVRRGLLLVGPPGTGKSAVCSVVGQELNRDGGFTIVYVEARAGVMLLTSVIEELATWGGGVLCVLEDLDLWAKERSSGGGGGLSDLLQAMDIDPSSRTFVLASTNSLEVLDRASIRTGRFDSICLVPYPDTASKALILAALLKGLPGGDGVDTAAVAAALPDQTSGSDIREIVRRAVLSSEVTTAGLCGQIAAGRYRAVLPTGGGTYL